MEFLSSQKGQPSSQEQQPSLRRRVAIIGAGYCGLCALRHFLSDPKYEATAFELSHQVGGVWNYPQRCEERTNEQMTSPFYTRMYRNMRTNLPKDLMALEGFSFLGGESSYIDASTVLQYLQSYADHFKLHPHIKLDHRVNVVTPILSEHVPANAVGPRWLVEYEDFKRNLTVTEIFDVVFVCNGKNHTPFVPEFFGLANFQGQRLHSSDYREPGRFAGQNVLLLGGGPSAGDIALDLISSAKTVILAKRQPMSFFKDQFPNLKETAIPQGFTAHGAILEDGSTADIDAVILCTGFAYDFPFLSKECRVEASRGRVTPLYRHLINAWYPTMAIPFVVTLVTLTPILDGQVKFFKAVLDGKVRLPSTEKMLQLTEDDYRQRIVGNEEGGSRNIAHGMEQEIWAYLEEMGREAGFDAVEPVYPKMCAAAFHVLRTEFTTFKRDFIQRVDSESFWHVKKAEPN
ncbi:putative Senecionine N-oxygenase [Hypsibius exemplaris]|uniref:Flavin-containing monooxygenase n=1 Tax=Hypsibius exemplaris TaxID=2072580 RepID=A0A1W0WZE2_HYPEX|nr:putative Senecionine N-oxygenase [Hypsibius exemplaris]